MDSGVITNLFHDPRTLVVRPNADVGAVDAECAARSDGGGNVLWSVEDERVLRNEYWTFTVARRRPGDTGLPNSLCGLVRSQVPPCVQQRLRRAEKVLPK